MAATIETPVYVTSSSHSIVSTSARREGQYQRSLFRRAWDKVESILVHVQKKSSSELREEEDDELLSLEFQNPLNPHRRNVLKEGSIKSRFSTDSGVLDERTSATSSRASSLRRYDPWQQRINDELQQTKVEHEQIKDMIAGWAMGETGPWFY